MGTEVRQMVEAGFNPLAEISRTTGESMLSLQKRMADGAISASEVAAALQSATSEGGKFFGMVESRAKTTAGQIDLLRGQRNMFKADLATETLPVANAAVSGGSWALKQFKNAQGEWERFMGPEGGFFNTAPTLGGNVKANKILNDLATYDSRVKAAEAAQSKQQTFDNIKGLGSSLLGAGMNTASGIKSLLLGDEYGRSGAFQNIGNEWQFLITEQMKAMTADYQASKATNNEAVVAETKELKKPPEMPGVATRGSREEFQLRSRISSAAMQAQKQEAQHKEAQDVRHGIQTGIEKLVSGVQQLIGLQPEPVG
jgi:hypothetical protein